MTVMEADESDEYLKIVSAPQLLKFCNISDQIHSVYQLMQLQILSDVDNIRKNMAAPTGVRGKLTSWSAVAQIQSSNIGKTTMTNQCYGG